LADFGSFVAGIPAPLGIGKVQVADGHWVTGFICEGAGIADATDISHTGDWKTWLSEQQQ
jgi:allophanate hydrolase